MYNNRHIKMDLNHFNDSDNSDIDELDQDATLPWMESNVSCYICNGYYGPSFEEPVCGTCHAFLFPDLLDHLEQLPITIEKTDDDDSGNDEPVDLFYCIGEARPGPVAGPNEDMAEPNVDRDNIDPVVDPQEIPRVETPPPIIVPPARPLDLERRLEMLSEPREPDVQMPMVKKLPPEVLLAIFGFLDDLSLCNAAAVCTQWKHLLKTHISPSVWRRYTMARWPLFQPIVEQDWFKTYTGLMSSCFCRTCLIQMALQSSPMGEENSWRRNRLRNELKIMRSDPPEGIEAVPLDGECCHWQAAITGPVGSPYEGGLFYLYVQVPYSYPMMPPRVRFLTRILHPNVSRHGDVGIDSIQHNWSLALTISKVLISVQSLLTDPFTLVCMEPSLGHMYRVDRSAFEKLARKWTWKYAMMDALPL